MLPGENPKPYAVFVDEKDMVWISDFGSNAFVRFNPMTGIFDTIEIPTQGANVRQILGTMDQVWGAESGTDKLAMVIEKSTPN
jgi:virginiamycin B lyase